MKVKLIYNAHTGQGIFPMYLDYVIQRFQEKGYEIEPFRTSTPDTIEGMMKNLQPNNYKKILVAGSDGIINQVVNAMVKYNVQLPLGIYPVGTVNDFASYFNFPKSIEEMTYILLQDNYTLADVGIVNDKRFINVVSFGILTDISQKTSLFGKKNFGVFAYYLNALTEIPNVSPINITIKAAELSGAEQKNVFSGEALLVLILNGTSAGGFNHLAPSASVNDSLLEVLVFKDCYVHELLVLLAEAQAGHHIESKHVVYFQASNLVIESDQPLPTEIDGETGPDFPLNVGICPTQLRVLTRNNGEVATRKHHHEIDIKEVKQMLEGLSKAITLRTTGLPTGVVSRDMLSNVGSLIKDLPRHDALFYKNMRALNEEYFLTAEQTLNNGYLYLVLSSTGSAAAEAIATATQKPYSHVSLSFDEDLKTLISYNGGDGVHFPGLNAEALDSFYKKETAHLIIYKMVCGYEAKKNVLDEIRKINDEGSSYNVLGLFAPYSHRNNIMVCSQFVYAMLQRVGLAYFDKKPEQVRPMDFIELDYERRLHYCCKHLVKDLVGKRNNDLSLSE